MRNYRPQGRAGRSCDGPRIGERAQLHEVTPIQRKLSGEPGQRPSCLSSAGTSKYTLPRVIIPLDKS